MLGLVRLVELFDHVDLGGRKGTIEVAANENNK